MTEDRLFNYELEFKEMSLSELKSVQKILSRETNYKLAMEKASLNKAKVKVQPIDKHIPFRKDDVTAAMIENPQITRIFPQDHYYPTEMQTLFNLAICPTMPTSVKQGYIGTDYHEEDLLQGLVKKEKKMYHDYDDDCNCAPVNVEARKMDYLKGRLEDQFLDKEHALPKAFGLLNDDPPHTPKEFVDRILAGKFELKDKAKDTHLYGSSPSPYITWRDPKVKVDQEGYDKAYKTLQEEFTKAKDTIVIKSPEEGLKALEKFESKTFH